MKIYKCDLCGRIVDDVDNRKFKLPYVDRDCNINEFEEQYDLCSVCIKKIGETMVKIYKKRNTTNESVDS